MLFIDYRGLMQAYYEVLLHDKLVIASAKALYKHVKVLSVECNA